MRTMILIAAVRKFVRDTMKMELSKLILALFNVCVLSI